MEVLQEFQALISMNAVAYCAWQRKISPNYLAINSKISKIMLGMDFLRELEVENCYKQAVTENKVG